jgi:glutamate-1-semialdehyde 2,1-aminomutase
MDDQWLVSLAHTNEDMDLLVTGIRELAVALRA